MKIPLPNLYGLMIGTGIFLAVNICERAQKKLGKKDKNYLTSMTDSWMIWVTVGAVIGARAYHVIDLWEYYQTHPQQIIAIWEGGIGIFGAILGGIIGILGFTIWANRKTKTKLPLFTRFLYITDPIAIGIPVAQAVGRLGNFFNQELFGRPTTLPWGIYIDPANRPTAYLESSYFHPLFAYEALLNLILFTFLWRLLKKNTRLGTFTGIYLAGYSLIRFILEFLRIDPWTAGILTTGQLMGILLFTLGVIIILKYKINPHQMSS